MLTLRFSKFVINYSATGLAYYQCLANEQLHISSATVFRLKQVDCEPVEKKQQTLLLLLGFTLIKRKQKTINK